MSQTNGFRESISLMTSLIMAYPCHYIVKFDDKGHIESFDKVIDEPFREAYERDMDTLRQLMQMEGEMLRNEQNKLRELRAWQGSGCDQVPILRDYIL